MRLSESTEYRRLPVDARSVGRHVSFWLASDHLLVVDVAGFTERSRKYRLSEIRAVTVQPDRRGLAWTVLLGVLALGACGISGALGWVAAGEDWPGPAIPVLILLGIPSAALAVCFLGSLLRIRTGTLTLLTTAHEGPMPGVGQLATARRLAALIREAAGGASRSTPDAG